EIYFFPRRRLNTRSDRYWSSDVCSSDLRRVRALPKPLKPYLIFVTARARTQDIVTGLTAGADDYIVKPFQREELRARVRVGERLLELQTILADRVRELEDALARVKLLHGLLPICSYCKKVRDD